MDYRRLYDDKCGTCKYYAWDEKPQSKGFRCKHHGWCEEPGEKKCSSYDRGYVDNATIESKLKDLDRWRRSWYIVTAVSNILGIPEDNNPYRDAFSRIIEEYLIGTKDGEQLLSDYDVYGKNIGWLLENIASTQGNEEMINSLINDEILPEFDKMLKNVKEGNINRAVLRYIILTRRLMDRFNIAYTPVQPMYEETEYSQFHNTLLAYKRSK